MAYPIPFDFKNPDYTAVWTWRINRIADMRANPAIIPSLKAYYRDNPIDFIEDFGVTFDPRNPEVGRPALIPLILFPKQKEFLQFVLDHWKERKHCLSDKSRDMGLTVCLSALLTTLAIFHPGFVGGFGSRKEDLVDKAGDPDSIFFKVRMFLAHLPKEFNGGWNPRNYNHSSHMRVIIPNSGGVVRGEAGNNIGRGGRASIYVVDESAHLAQPWAVENSLSQTTNCRVDISSVNGMDNPFAEKRFSGRVDVMTMHWTDDPRKDRAWYDKQCAQLNPLVIAQELDLDYSASKEGVLIPSAWVMAAIDAHITLKVPIAGVQTAALDVADEGIDLNAFGSRKGVVMTHVEKWSGKGSTIYFTALRAMNLCVKSDIPSFYFDSDGLGVGIRGDAEAINALPDRGERQIEAIPFRGSGKVIDPEKKIMQKLTNEEVFQNRKAQGWWHLRTLFENTYKAVVENLVVDLDEIVSIPSNLPERAALVSELSQPTYAPNTAGKIVVNKAPDGTKSPNLADMMMILYAPKDTERRGIFG